MAKDRQTMFDRKKNEKHRPADRILKRCDYTTVVCQGVRLEVIVTIVSKLVYFTYFRDVSNLLIQGWNNPFTNYQQDIPVTPYKPSKWPYILVTVLITITYGSYFTPVITGRAGGPPCKYQLKSTPGTAGSLDWKWRLKDLQRYVYFPWPIHGDESRYICLHEWLMFMVFM